MKRKGNKEMKKDFNCCKKVRDQLSKLGYDGELNYPAVAQWLMDEHDYYIMPMPQPYWRWEVGVVILGKPNKQDLKLNRCSIKESVRSLDAAVRAGVEFVVNSLDNARKVVEKYNYDADSDYVKQIRKDLLEEGFDL